MLRVVREQAVPQAIYKGGTAGSVQFGGVQIGSVVGGAGAGVGASAMCTGAAMTDSHAGTDGRIICTPITIALGTGSTR